MSKPGFNLAISIASTINFKASSLEFIDGANPPSSPTLVRSFLDFKIFFKFCMTKKHFSIASIKFFAESGLIINSCIFRSLSAWTPPLMMFIKG